MRPRQSGQAILLFIVLIGVAGGLLGLAIDGSRVFEEKRRVQSMADAAAIGAALEMKSSSSEAAWTQAAMDDVRINGFRDDSDQINVTKVAAGADQDGVQVSVTRRVRTTLMAMFGTSELFVRAQATAALTQGAAPCLLALAEDGPGALVVEGEGAIRIDCDVEVRSIDPESLLLPEDGCLSANGVRANSVDNACVSPRPTPMEKRLASFTPGPEATCSGRPAGAATESAEGVVYYWPGCYPERIEIDGGRTELSPGEYVLLDGLEITGGEVSAKDVSVTLLGGPLEILDDAWVAMDAGERPYLFDTGSSEGAARITPAEGSLISGGLRLIARDFEWRPNSGERPSWNSVVAQTIRLQVEDDTRVISGPSGLRELSAARPVLIR